MLAHSVAVKRAFFLAAFLAIVANVGAGTYQLTFSGTYTMSTVLPESGPLFGVSSLPAPFTYSITYDTALDTNTHYFPPGSTIGGKNVLQPFYGYSASGILATDLTFGTQTWTAADIRWLNPSSTIGAELWFDTDIDVATPTNSWIMFSQGTAYLELGAGALMGLGDEQGLGYLPGRSTLFDYYGPSGEYLAFNTTITRTPLASVPDGGSPLVPAMLALVILGTIHRCRSARAFAASADAG